MKPPFHWEFTFQFSFAGGLANILAWIYIRCSYLFAYFWISYRITIFTGENGREGNTSRTCEEGLRIPGLEMCSGGRRPWAGDCGWNSASPPTPPEGCSRGPQWAVAGHAGQQQEGAPWLSPPLLPNLGAGGVPGSTPPHSLSHMLQRSVARCSSQCYPIRISLLITIALDRKYQRLC